RTCRAPSRPSPPKRLDVLDTTDSTVVLGWLKPEHDGGSRIQGYLIEARPKGGDKWVVVGNTKNLTYTVDKLNKNDQYDFRVKAKNDAGHSLGSNPSPTEAAPSCTTWWSGARGRAPSPTSQKETSTSLE
uniref:Fibronectin type-III domain-containing protein n=1 Tax=Periophthalmus magnuspinnatus TaxID=409849 RepID=A0A3B4ADB1_9GOBI